MWPSVGDGVAHQYDAFFAFGGCAEFFVCFGVAFPVAKLVFLCLGAKCDAEHGDGCNDSCFHS